MKRGKVSCHILKGFVVHQIDGLDLKGLHEVLGFGIVIGIAASAHGADETMFGEPVAVGLGSVLRPPDQSGGCNPSAAALFG
jgi:hypothetical protein